MVCLSVHSIVEKISTFIFLDSMIIYSNAVGGVCTHFIELPVRVYTRSGGSVRLIKFLQNLKHCGRDRYTSQLPKYWRIGMETLILKA